MFVWGEGIYLLYSGFLDPQTTHKKGPHQPELWVATDGRNPAPFKNPWDDVLLQIPTNNGLPWFQSGARFRPCTVSSLASHFSSSMYIYIYIYTYIYTYIYIYNIETKIPAIIITMGIFSPAMGIITHFPCSKVDSHRSSGSGALAHGNEQEKAAAAHGSTAETGTVAGEKIWYTPPGDQTCVRFSVQWDFQENIWDLIQNH